MARFLKSPDETVWQALSRQERRAFNRYNTLSTQAAAVDRETGDTLDVVHEARRHWRRTVRECDTYLDRARDISELRGERRL
jgi:hypothetical protein